jgi:hypothetical protein
MLRGVLDANINVGAHSKFVGKWLEKWEAEESQR